MDDRHVTTVCRCGCDQALPAAPAGGGRAPVYASAACRQRAHRQRRPAVTAAAAVDPPSVAVLLAQVRELAAALDAGRRPDTGGVQMVEDLAAQLVARARAHGQDRLLPWVDAAGQARTALDDGDVEALAARLYAEGAQVVGPPHLSRPACDRWVAAWRRDTDPDAGQAYAPLELAPGYPLSEIDARALVADCRGRGESWTAIAARAGVPVTEARTRWG